MEKDIKIEDIAQDVNKITDEELKSVQEKVNKINQVQMQIGGMELQKKFAIDQVTTFQAELKVVQDELEEKYGQVSINLVDGTITPLPKEDETDKKD